MWKLTHLTNGLKKPREIRTYLRDNINKNRTNQNLQETAKAVLRQKFIAIKTYIKKQTYKKKTPNPKPADRKK